MGVRRVCSAVCVGGLLVLAGCAQAAEDDAQLDGTQSPAATAGGNAAPESGDPTLTGRLLFSRFDEDSHMFLTTHISRPDGSEEREIAMPSTEGGGRWSRSGDYIAVPTSLTDGRIGTAIMTPDGTIARVLDFPDDSLNLACTVWSPDDQRLACEGWDEVDASRNGIYTISSSDGSELVRLTETPADLADFVGDYSPDGTMFLFKRTTEEDPAPLMVVPVAGGAETLLSDLQVEDPGRYSPDGTTILTSAGGRIVLLDTAGVEVGEIVEPGSYLFGPVWSPDGEHVGYSGDEAGAHADIFTATPDGTDRRQVTSTPDNEIRVEWGRN